jgi:hypothetical protein
MKVYESIPAADAMTARCARDKIDASTLVEVVAPRGHYAIRCLARPTTTLEFDGKETKAVPAFILYSVRRDGKICNGWNIPHAARKMIEIGGVAQ